MYFAFFQIYYRLKVLISLRFSRFTENGLLRFLKTNLVYVMCAVEGSNL